MQSELTALQGAIHDLKNLKQKFEQTKIFELNMYIYLKWHIKFKQKLIEISQKAVLEERSKNRTFKN